MTIEPLGSDLVNIKLRNGTELVIRDSSTVGYFQIATTGQTRAKAELSVSELTSERVKVVVGERQGNA